MEILVVIVNTNIMKADLRSIIGQLLMVLRLDIIRIMK